MKNLIYSAVLLFSFIAVATAQVTTAALQGEWKFTALQANGVYYDINTGNLQLDESLKTEGEPTAEELAMLSEQMKQQVDPFAKNTISFDKDKMKLHYGEADRSGTYTIVQKDNKYFIEATYDTGAKKEIEFSLEGKLLHLIITSPDGTTGSMIYKQG
jgi:uncharacterized FlaG/YvyC family protein